MMDEATKKYLELERIVEAGKQTQEDAQRAEAEAFAAALTAATGPAGMDAPKNKGAK